MGINKIQCWKPDFHGSKTYSTTALDGLVVHEDSAAGTPTAKTVSGGGVELLLDATNEVQRISLHQGDVLSFPANKVRKIRGAMKVAATNVLTNAIVMIGLSEAYNDDEDAITDGVWFKCEGNANIVCESDDSVNNNDDVATGVAITTNWKEFEIDFMKGLSDVRFRLEDGNGSVRNVATSTTFDMSNASDHNFQFMAKCEKASGTETPKFYFKDVEVEYKS